MVAHMKTTVEIPDELLNAAKETALREERTLRDFMEEALRTALAQRDRPGTFRLREGSFGGRGL